MRGRHSGALLLLSAMCLSRCGGDRAFVEVSVTGLTGVVTSLRVSSTLDGVADQNTEMLTAAMNPFTLELPAGAAGPLVVSVDAVDDNGCLQASGQARAAIAGTALQMLSLPLVPFYPLQVKTSGSGSGTVVTDVMGRSDSTSGCPSPLFSKGTAVTLTAKPNAGSYFTGWTSGCTNGTGTCMVTLDAATAVTARFSSWVAATAGTSANLSGVFSASASSAWAVGDKGTILHSDGAQWAAQISGTTNNLYATWGTQTEVWAVGDSGTILHYNGLLWATQQSPITTALRGIWGTGVGNIWAVGDKGAILHYDGTQWTAQTSGTLVALNATWSIGAKEAWAVGDSGTILRTTDGTTWKPVSSGGTASRLAGIWGGAAGDVWTVGEGGTMLHWDGSAWNLSAMVKTNFLRGVWGSGRNDIWSVGDKGTILHWNGTGWTAVTNPTAMQLSAVSGTSAAGAPSTYDVWAVGVTGTIVHYAP